MSHAGGLARLAVMPVSPRLCVVSVVLLSSFVGACGVDPAELDEALVEQRRDALTLLNVEAETWADGSNAAVSVAGASAGYALRVGSITRTLTPGAAGTSIAFRTRTENCPSGSTSLAVKVNGASIGTVTVTGSTFATTTLTASLPSAFSLNLVNSYTGNCRVLLDTVVVDGPTAPPVTTYLVVEAESATGGGVSQPPYRVFTTNGSATASFSITGTATYLTVPATGVRCHAFFPPRLIVSVDGVQVINQTVSTPTTFSAGLSTPPGTHTVTFAYADNYDVGTCNSSLSVDKATFTVVQ